MELWENRPRVLSAKDNKQGTPESQSVDGHRARCWEQERTLEDSVAVKKDHQLPPCPRMLGRYGNSCWGGNLRPSSRHDACGEKTGRGGSR